MTEWKLIWERDWPGIIATVIAFTLFGTAIYLIIESRYSSITNQERIQMLVGENERTRIDLLYMRELMTDHQMKLNELQKQLDKK